MNGAHDLGGMHGFGPVTIEANEPVFHHDWERRVFALQLASGRIGHWNIDQSRFAREQMPPADYLSSGYFEHWLFGLERLLDERGIVTRDELAGRLEEPASPAAAVPDAEPLRAADVGAMLGTSRASRSEATVEPRYRVGDAVLSRNPNGTGHTRLPRYARGKRGVVVADHGVWVFPDSIAMGNGPRPQHCYTVRFPARELWGGEAPAADAVFLDLWDDHLDPVP